MIAAGGALARYLVVVLLVAVAPKVWAAQAQPPLMTMANPQLVLVAGSVVAVTADPPSIKFKVSDAVRGGAIGEMRLLVDAPLLALLAPGDGYLALYTDMESAPLKPRKMVHAPERSRLLAFEGVEISLFRDSPEMRALLREDPRASAAATGYRDRVLQGLTDDDPQMADLWSGELTLRAERLSPYSADEIALIERLIGQAQYPPTARARLLQMANARAPLFGREGYLHAAAEVVASTPVFTQPVRGADTLLYTALKILAERPEFVDAAAVEPWLTAQPVVAEAAALALRAKAPALETEALDRVLGRALLNGVTRGFLQEHRRRLLLQAAPADQSGERRVQ